MNDLHARSIRPLAILLLVTPSLARASETFDVVRFDAPPGFTAQRDKDHVAFTRIDQAAKTFCQIALYSSRPSTNPLEKEFAAEWKQLAAGEASAEVPAITSGKTRAGIAWARGEQSVSKGGQNFRARLFTLEADRAVLSVLANASNDDAMKKCQPAVDDLLASMALIHPAAAAPTAASGVPATSDVPGGKGVLPGVWMGVENSLIGHAQGAGSLSERYASFYDDGTWFFDVPSAGYAGFNRATSRSERAAYWGTWKLSGSDGEVFRPEVKRKMPVHVRKDDEIDLDGTRYYKCASVNGLKLDGAWTSYADPTDPGLKKPGVQPIIHFTPDGKFRDDGLFQLLLGITDEPARRAPGSGTYTIGDWTLVLTYDDGHVRNGSITMFLREAPDPKTKFLYLAHSRLARMP